MKPDQEIVKVCGCGKRYTRAQWLKLKYVGVMKTTDHEPGHAPRYYETELRDCPCKSTLAIETEIQK